jgi:hypothetical protein
MIDPILEKAKEKARKIELLKKDKRVRGVMAFFIKKGFLISNYDFGHPPRQISAKDCVFTAQNFEPRIFAVLPAALIHFKRAIVNTEELPVQVKQAVKAILAGEEIELSMRGICYKEMSSWARQSILDKRVKPVGQKKIVKTFRLSPETLKKLDKIAKEQSSSLTATLEKIILEVQ